MRFHRSYAGLALVTLCACSPKNPPPLPSSPTNPTTTQLLPRSPDITREVMGWLVVSNGAELAQQLAPEGNLDPQRLQAALLAQLGISPDLARVVDLNRPLAVALLNPGLLAVHAVEPYVAMVPVRSQRALEQVLTAHHTPFHRVKWGLVVPTGQASMQVAFTGGYAVVAWRSDLLAATIKTLGPQLRQKPEAPVRVHLAFANLREAYGPQLDALLRQTAQLAGQGGEAGDPQVAFALRGVRRIAHYLHSVSDLDLLANLDSGGLTLTVRAEGDHDGAFSGYVRQQRPGPAWGIQYLPRDSVMAYATHDSPVARAADVAAAVRYAAEVGPVPGPADVSRLQTALQQAALSTDGELAYAVWPGRAGGVGVGGAYRIANPVAARAAAAQAYEVLSPHLGAMVMRALGFDATKLAANVEVHRRTARFGEVNVDLVEVSVDWPKGAEAERRVFEALFGPKLVLGTAYVGQSALFALGADYRERLAAMIGTAQGVPAASLGEEPSFAAALKYKQTTRVSMSYLLPARMAHFSAGLVQASRQLDGADERAVARLTALVGHGAIVSTTNASGRRYELTTHVPKSALVGVAALNGALWRIALSPLLNPPMMPPLPLPPPHVTPSVRHVSTRGTL